MAQQLVVDDGGLKSHDSDMKKVRKVRVVKNDTLIRLSP